MTGVVAVALRAAVARGRLRHDRVVPARRARWCRCSRSWWLRHAVARRTTAPAAGLGGTAARSSRRAARAAGAGARWCSSRPTLAGHDRPSSLCRRPDARAARSSRRADARQFQLRFRAPAGTKFESTETLGARRPRRRSAQTAGRRATWRSRWAMSASSRRQLSDQHHLPVDRRLARGRAPGGASARRADEASSACRKSCAARSRALPRCPVLVRTGRHRQPDHELQLADAGSKSRSWGPTSPPAGVRCQGARQRSRRIGSLRDLQYGQTARLSRHPGRTSIASWRGSSASPSTRSAVRSPPPRRRAASSRRTTGPIRAPASRSRCRSQVPQPRMTSLEDLRVVPVTRRRHRQAAARRCRPHRERAPSSANTTAYNGQRMVTLTANVPARTSARVATEVNAAIGRAGEPPAGRTVAVRGQVAADAARRSASIAVGLVRRGRR